MEIDDLLPFVDVFLPNEHEARGLTGLEDPVEAAVEFQRRSAGWVVVKLGAEGCAGVGPEGEMVRVPPPKVEALDTTGAGDAFDGAIVFALSRGGDWRSILEFATREASALVAGPAGDSVSISLPQR